jgi:uncharacterized protein DUF4157
LLGYDLEKVMIFANPEVDQALGAMSADAAALGSDVFMKQSKFNPASSEGEALLAHELTHVAQFLGQGTNSGKDLEKEALQIERQVRQGKTGAGFPDRKDYLSKGTSFGRKPVSAEQLHTAATDRTYWPNEQVQSGNGYSIRWSNGQVDQVSQQTLNQAYALAARMIKDKRNEFEYLKAGTTDEHR